MTLLEFLLELFQLVGAEGGPVSSELGLLGAVQTRVVFAVGVRPGGRTQKAVVRMGGTGRAGGTPHHRRTSPGSLESQRTVRPEG